MICWNSLSRETLNSTYVVGTTPDLPGVLAADAIRGTALRLYGSPPWNRTKHRITLANRLTVWSPALGAVGSNIVYYFD